METHTEMPQTTALLATAIGICTAPLGIAQGSLNVTSGEIGGLNMGGSGRVAHIWNREKLGWGAPFLARLVAREEGTLVSRR